MWKCRLGVHTKSKRKYHLIKRFINERKRWNITWNYSSNTSHTSEFPKFLKSKNNVFRSWMNSDLDSISWVESKIDTKFDLEVATIEQKRFENYKGGFHVACKMPSKLISDIISWNMDPVKLRGSREWKVLNFVWVEKKGKSFL